MKVKWSSRATMTEKRYHKRRRQLPVIQSYASLPTAGQNPRGGRMQMEQPRPLNTRGRRRSRSHLVLLSREWSRTSVRSSDSHAFCWPSSSRTGAMSENKVELTRRAAAIESRRKVHPLAAMKGGRTGATPSPSGTGESFRRRWRGRGHRICGDVGGSSDGVALSSE